MTMATITTNMTTSRISGIIRATIIGTVSTLSILTLSTTHAQTTNNHTLTTKTQATQKKPLSASELMERINKINAEILADTARKEENIARLQKETARNNEEAAKYKKVGEQARQLTAILSQYNNGNNSSQPKPKQ